MKVRNFEKTWNCKGPKIWADQKEWIQDNHCFCCCGERRKLYFECIINSMLPGHAGAVLQLGFNRCAFYVAGSPEFRCRCPHRWGRKAGHKTCLWNFGQINANMTAREQRSEQLTSSAHPHVYYSVSEQMKTGNGWTRQGEKFCLLHVQSYPTNKAIFSAFLLLGGMI